MLRIPSDEPVLFASDMHLAPEAPDTAARFLDALEHEGPRARHLFLLGDVFERWQRGSPPCCRAWRRTASRSC
jgi:UDP-2,3-diacylglucosamine pyrophosphatase LpxH